MNLGIVIVKDLTGGFEALGDPVPYSEAKEVFTSAANDAGNIGRYSEVQLWTKDGIRKRRPLTVPMAPSESAPEESKREKPVSKKAARKKAAPQKQK